jgi:hypothetical protein
VKERVADLLRVWVQHPVASERLAFEIWPFRFGHAELPLRGKPL